MVMELFRDPIWLTASSLGLALLFAAAGWHKLTNPAAFTVILRSYELMPVSLVNPLARLVPLLELATALSLLLVPVAPAVFLAACLLLVYAGAMALSLRAGLRIADCGCQFGAQRQAVSAGLVWRNLVLTVLALNLLQAASGREQGLYDWLVTGVLLLCGCVLYFLANTLIANQQSARELSL